MSKTKKTTNKRRANTTSTSGGGLMQNKPLLVALGICLLTALVYLPSLFNDFTNWDDTYYVTQNELITKLNPEHLYGIFTTSERSLYHPFTMLSFAFNYMFSGLNPFAYHFTSLLFHVLNTALVFWFVWLLSRKKLIVSAITALFFALHPMHVESVAWVSERKDVLYTFFFMLALVAHLKYLAKEQAKYYWLCLLAGTASLFSKATAVMLPIILLLLDHYWGRLDLRKPFKNIKVWLEKTPFFILSVIFGLLTIHYQSQGAIGDFEAYSIPQRFAFAAYGFVMYILKLFVPVKLSAFYPYPDVANGLPAYYWLFLLAFIVILGLAFWSLRKGKVLFFGIMFYFFMVALTLQFVSVGGAIMADRYTYVPYIGLFFALGWGLQHLYDTKGGNMARPIGLGVLALAAVCALLTVNRIKVWQNSKTLWTDVIEKYPSVPYAYYNRGLVYHYGENAHKDCENNKACKGDEDCKDKKACEAALTDYNAAIERKSTYADAFYNRGKLQQYEFKRFDEALQDYTQALTLKPDLADAHHVRGILYHYELAEFDKALSDYNKALELKPKLHKALNNRGTLYFNKLKKFDLALADFDKAIALHGDDAQYHINRSYAYYAKGNFEVALQNALKAKQMGFGVTEKYLNMLKSPPGQAPTPSQNP